jgi:glucokinase
LDEPSFRDAFEALPPYRQLLVDTPTLLMTCVEPGLIGCAVLASVQMQTA